MKDKKISRILLSLVAISIVLVAACDSKLSPIEKDWPTPGPVGNVKVENFQGGATLTYDLPPGKELWYVKAEYEIRPGVKREKKATYYTNQIVLDGFGKTGDYDVKLYAVSRDEKESEPVVVQVHPDTPPIESVYETLVMNEDFGGLNVSMKNDTEADIVMYIVTLEPNGVWEPVETYYTRQRQGIFTARGFEPEERRFGVYIRDRWENYSDTLVGDLTPYFEMELDKSRFKEVRLPTDTWQKRYAGSAGVSAIWNGNRATSGQNHNFQSILPSPIPQWFTFDLGVTAKLSRMQYWMKAGLFAQGNAKVIEIWGSTDPDPDGSWESWTLMATFTSFKPSGLPLGSTTEEDIAHATAGDNFVFPADAPLVRYIRFKTLEVWDPATQNVWVNEISMFGSVEE
ncbi:DUF5000 domain-containing lipoprotein [Sphingobacterium gobiense]|uniref:F5/8 type C domain-containing protein n=1 Tax=Sphingobacterium gobiense TaxID=1382456 RepID=A0A2S9JTN4_9SPHI|nr:DUF5000 domain-containing lipoprotein [Sphingobacterium gobiense]PRD56642.1 hypothetical protein C5749_05250 [Sphingobacterium gobiense]